MSDPRIVLETERLFLREMTLDRDLEPLTAHFGDAETMRYYPRTYTRDESRDWIERNLRRYEEDGFGLWTMVLKDDGTWAGMTGLTWQDVDGARHVELGWHTARRHWGEGLAPEAGAECRDHAFDALGIDLLVCITGYDNIPSQRAAHRVGFKPWRATVRAMIPHVVWAMRPADRT
jgi:ribosomal-protein-alanine N-acetyltransferase